MTAPRARDELDALVKQGWRPSDRDLLLILEMLNERVKDLERIVHRQEFCRAKPLKVRSAMIVKRKVRE
jgi:hypothetical protein